ncbi:MULTISPECIES: DUF4339 domain-containing protein [unclassified Lentimonas]|uniref:DUF4339 domain-containing protein n=1 Tax=unclassified Lentimonas TaxID=2630993 RepID=UPI00132A9880|nr:MULTISPECIES: DUF4339 domain-containing protein [unclassified Lentimonas]CAA6680139.1 Unannotated [Lentimonas sp. CC4]CAA6685594.1 Unannotated [Lentimonas sp. CC6]CAA6689662.1 Unannotated [Lentimonas sp. CC19]CAA6692677.1 Unannotated [Lentimonas sp. CC10]CAA7069251.1 Unannotated [Lentimonas sp. CC11]
MADYYIRTPDREESRGPFDASQLLTLAEAGQITVNTLHYDETKEEWIPIALNEQLKADVFPDREKLSLKVSETKKPETQENDESQEKEGLNVTDMLAAAERDTDETRHLKKKEESLHKAAALSTTSIGIMLLLSAIALLSPHFAVINAAISEERAGSIFNYPFIAIGLFDFIMAAFLFLAVTEIYPLLRARAMLTLGFGVYVGWSIGDPIIMLAAGAAGVGIFYATIAQRYSTMIIVSILGIGGNAALAYLSIIGHFAGFFDSVYFNLIPTE